MTVENLMAISPLDGRYHDKVNPLRHIFSEYGLIKFRLFIEVRWLEMLIEFAHIKDLKPLSPQAKKLLNDLVNNFSTQDALRIKQIEARINHDVKAVEYFLKEKLGGNPELEKIIEFIHFGCTSEDINNLAYSLMLKTALKESLLPSLTELLKVLLEFAHRYATVPMLSRTHGQPATPTTLGKEIANVIARLQRQIQQLTQLHLLGKLNGASGNYNALTIAYPEIDWQSISQKFVTTLGLEWNPYTTQIEPHDSLAECFAILIRINTILIDFDRDVWGYICLNYFKQKPNANEVGSSTMPHKINPIDFENSEGNLGIANTLLNHMGLKLPISRFQRDLSDSTVLRNMGVTLSHMLLGITAITTGMRKLEPNQDMIDKDLNQHWEVLAEAIQTIMRKYKIEQPYEKLKNFTRGKVIDQKILQEFIAKLDLPKEIKQQLLKLTPQDYIGYAQKLANEIK